MKKLLTLFIAGFIATFAFASNNYNEALRPFIFVENDIEFAVFHDGQFDFTILPQRNVAYGVYNDHLEVSFNAGHRYGNALQYDRFGAIIRILRTPVYYDNFGRVTQLGHTSIRYNRFGTIHRIGNLYVDYNSYGRYAGYHGNINRNRCVAMARHHYYRVPPRSRCIVNTRPYRSNYHVNNEVVINTKLVSPRDNRRYYQPNKKQNNITTRKYQPRRNGTTITYNQPSFNKRRL